MIVWGMGDLMFFNNKVIKIVCTSISVHPYLTCMGSVHERGGGLSVVVDLVRFHRVVFFQTTPRRVIF